MKITEKQLNEIVNKAVKQALSEQRSNTIFKLEQKSTGRKFNVKAQSLTEAKQKLGKYLKEETDINYSYAPDGLDEPIAYRITYIGDNERLWGHQFDVRVGEEKKYEADPDYQVDAVYL